MRVERSVSGADCLKIRRVPVVSTRFQFDMVYGKPRGNYEIRIVFHSFGAWGIGGSWHFFKRPCDPPGASNQSNRNGWPSLAKLDHIELEPPGSRCTQLHTLRSHSYRFTGFYRSTCLWVLSRHNLYRYERSFRFLSLLRLCVETAPTLRIVCTDLCVGWATSFYYGPHEKVAFHSRL